MVFRWFRRYHPSSCRMEFDSGKGIRLVVSPVPFHDLISSRFSSRGLTTPQEA